MSCVALLLFVFYNFILFPYLPGPEIFSPAIINKNPSWVESIGPGIINKIPSWVESIELWSGIISLVVLIFYGARRPIGLLVGVIFCLMIFLQTTTNLRYGTWIADKRDTISLEQMEAEKKEKLTYYRSEGGELFSHSLWEFINFISTVSRDFYTVSRDSTVRHLFQKIPMASIFWDYLSVSSREEVYHIIRKRVKGI